MTGKDGNDEESSVKDSKNEDIDEEIDTPKP